MQEIQLTAFDVNQLRKRLQKMTDNELREFGRAAAHMVSPKANMGQPRDVCCPISGGSRGMGKKTSEKKSDDNLSDFKVGDRVKVDMHRGRIVEAEVKAVVEKTHGVRLQVSFGNETALIYLWQVVEKIRSL